MQKEICDLLRPGGKYGDHIHPAIAEISDDLENLGLPYQQQTAYFDWFSRNLPAANSIDSFLEAQSRGDDYAGFIGKYCIANIISRRERESSLFLKRGAKLDFSKLSDTWLGQLWSKLNRGGPANLSGKGLPDVKFITFNYDRCIEHFLQIAFEEYYRLDQSQAKYFANNVNILHVYGSLGGIYSEEDGSIGFGDCNDNGKIVECSKRIRTYSESSSAAPLNNIRTIIDSSDNVIFIGFSFAPINQRLIGSAMESLNRKKDVYGTCYKMSSSDRMRAEAWMNGIFRINGYSDMHLEDCTGVEFFRNNQLLFG